MHSVNLLKLVKKNFIKSVKNLEIKRFGKKIKKINGILKILFLKIGNGMRIRKSNRKFFPLKDSNLQITDCGKIILKKDEQVTFEFNKKKYDFCCTNWGFYASPSINSRLKKEGFKIGLFKNKENKRYILAVDKDKIKNFKIFLKETKHSLINWL